MAMRTAVRALPCSSSTFEGGRPLSKVCENTHRVGKCEASPCHMSMTLTTSSYLSSLEVPGHAAEPCTFYDATLSISTEDHLSDDGSLQDDDSTSTYGEDDASYEAGSAYSDEDAFVDDVSTCSDQGVRISGPRSAQIRSWSLDKAALESKYTRAVNEVVEQTFLSAEHAGMLLRSFRWNTESAVDAWYSREGDMDRWLGLDDGTVPRAEIPSSPVVCGICLEKCEEASMAACEEHRFCNPCWTKFVDSAIASGKALKLCCPHRQEDKEDHRVMGCPSAVSDSMILAHASPAMRDLFVRLRLQSLVDSDRCLRWCPRPGCSFAVQIDAEAATGLGVVEVCCMSGHAFCWGCGEEPHAPVDCETARMWGKLNSHQGEEISLTLESIRDCPKCHVPIEKVGGCSHVECQCQHKFCWDCLEDLDTHNDEGCRGESDGPDLSQLRNREDLVSAGNNTYGRYFLRWLECEERERQVKAVLQDYHARSSEWGVTLETLSFIAVSWRRLKWMQASSYYQESESQALLLLRGNKAEAEKALEKLHAAVLSAYNPEGSEDARDLAELESVARILLLSL